VALLLTGCDSARLATQLTETTVNCDEHCLDACFAPCCSVAARVLPRLGWRRGSQAVCRLLLVRVLPCCLLVAGHLLVLALHDMIR